MKGRKRPPRLHFGDGAGVFASWWRIGQVPLRNKRCCCSWLYSDWFRYRPCDGSDRREEYHFLEILEERKMRIGGKLGGLMFPPFIYETRNFYATRQLFDNQLLTGLVYKPTAATNRNPSRWRSTVPTPCSHTAMSRPNTWSINIIKRRCIRGCSSRDILGLGWIQIGVLGR